MSAGKKSSWLAIIASSLIICITGCSRNSSKLESGHAQPIEKIKDDIQQILSKLNAQSGSNQREKLAELQARLSKGDTDTSEATKSLSAIRDSLPAIAAIELADPIAAIEWTIRMNELLNATQTADSLNETELLLDQAPISLGKTLLEDFSQKHAQKVLALGRAICSSDSPDLEDLELLLEMLNRQNPNGAATDALEELKKTLSQKSQDLQQTVLLDEVKNNMSAFESQLQTVSTIEDIELRYSALASLGQSIDSLRVQLTLQGHRSALVATDAAKAKLSDRLQQAFDAVTEKQRNAQRKARMRYQAWSLSEIEKFNSQLDSNAIDKELYRLKDEAPKSKEPVVVPWLAFPGVRSLFESSLGQLSDNRQLTSEQQAKIGAFAKEQWYPIRYQFEHDVAVRHLLPIDQGMLEPPVAKFFSEAFEKAWTRLEKEPQLRLSLARMAAEVSKRGLEEFVKE